MYEMDINQHANAHFEFECTITVYNKKKQKCFKLNETIVLLLLFFLFLEKEN